MLVGVETAEVDEIGRLRKCGGGGGGCVERNMDSWFCLSGVRRSMTVFHVELNDELTYADPVALSSWLEMFLTLPTTSILNGTGSTC